MGGTLLRQGLDLMSFGMGTVFVFLTVLVITTTLMSRIVSRFFPEARQSMAVTSRTSVAVKPVDEKTLKIIQAALDKHRNRL